ncbi:Gldg family protein [Ponticaulis sp.]|uniref:Gldg family protein n=1 Tax=Ponticaulis sp. TaxID=2020902 RepID=UPI000B6A14CC|nr:Gldg family protein [Ponticaulis sp.]MAI89783.1 hypothetical protein [Ponticaulis sp.]OUX99461.1 MAG: hypothetical protein CBB65_05030 [Hyphomonadaceae bacterium TMED5]
MNVFLAVYRREIRAFFGAPLAYVFIGVYLLLTGLATWNLARFFDTARVDLAPLFQFQPWFLALLAPAIGMRLWSEDLKARTVDIYLTLPVSLYAVHLAKAAAGLTVLLAALASTLPYWLVVSYLGAPDHGLIALNYLHLIAQSALFLTISMSVSALTRQQILALVLGVCISLLLLVLGLTPGQDVQSSFAPLSSWLRGYGLTDLIKHAQRGVFLFSDLLIYLGMIALAVLTGVGVLKARRNPSKPLWRYWSAGSLALLILATPMLRNLVTGSLAFARIDMTGYQLNTLSEGSRDLVRSLSEPIELTLFYSESIGQDYPNIRAHAERTEALLRAFEQAANGKIQIRTIDPEPFSDGEDAAVLQGVSAIPTEGIDPLYFGLSGRNLVADEDVIPFLSPEQDNRLEFEVASLIARLDSVSPARIGILSGLPALSAGATGSDRSAIQAAIERQYQVSWLSEDIYSLPEGLNAIIIAQPRTLTDYTYYLLDQYVQSGGRLIVLVDPEPVMYRNRTGAAALAPWWEAWGLSLTTDVLTDARLGLPVGVASASGQRSVSQPLFPAPGPREFNSEDFLTANLQQPINLGAPGYISYLATNDFSITPLISSTEAPGLLNEDARLGENLTPITVRDLTTPLEGPLAYAVRISGIMPALHTEAPEPALPDDPVLRRLAMAETERHVPVQRGAPAEILVIHDTDILFDAFYINPQDGSTMAGNRAFILSALDQFAGNPALARLRARPPAIRPMTRVTDLRAAAETEYLDEQTSVEAQLRTLETELQSTSPEQAAALQAEYLTARQRLRQLQRDFRETIDSLEAWLRFWTIWFPVGLMIVLGGTVRFWSRRLK